MCIATGIGVTPFAAIINKLRYVLGEFFLGKLSIIYKYSPAVHCQEMTYKIT